MEEKENAALEVGETGNSLQNCFTKFLEAKRRAMKNKNFISKEKLVDREDPQFRQQLRQKFINRAKHYIGTPYAQRYHAPDSELYHSPLFLDCCALVRQVVDDLHEDFGFSLGRWNQSYQFDVLSEETPFEALEPGDLVFYSATYYDPKKRKQLHDLVHVEIFMGGEQSLGSRWSNGRIQIFESFKFTSTNYYDIRYHFKSIEPWLRGLCRSHCPEHPWHDERKNLWLPHKSIFAEEQQEPDGHCCSVPEKVCFVGKGNNLELVRDCLARRGWAILPANYSFSGEFQLKWVQTHAEVNFFTHVEGQQLVNHIPNIGQVLCTKKALVSCARDQRSLLPVSFDLSDKGDLRKFLEEAEGAWIVKPFASNQGKGIFLVNDLGHFKEQLRENSVSRSFVTQKYVEDPLLVGGHKFDIRFFALIASSQPLLVLGYEHCYGRKSLNLFSLESNDILTHLTNASQQKKHPEYATRKEETILSEDSLNEVLNGGLQSIRARVFRALDTLITAKQHELVLRAGCFELLGVDVLIDAQLEPYIIEINVNPAMWTDTAVQKSLFPGLIENTLSAVLTGTGSGYSPISNME